MKGLPDKTWVTVGEVADYWRLSTDTVYRMIDDGELVAVRIRGSLRVRREQIIDHETKNIINPAGPFPQRM